MTDIDAALGRIEAAHAEFNRVAGETLAILADLDARAAARSEAMRAATHEAIAAIDALIERTSS